MGEIISAHSDSKLEKKSFETPYTISENNAGRMFRVVNINGDKIGLVEWGYKENHLGDIQTFKNYYFISGIPKDFQNTNQIFHVQMTKDKGLIFHQIKFNGHKDINKRPFELLEKIYTV